MYDMSNIDAETRQQPERDEMIRQAQNRVISRMTMIPEHEISTTATTGRIGEGLTCTIEQGKFSAVSDLGAGMGGDAAGPSPSFYARAAIVGCVGIAVKMRAAREGLVFRSVLVTVETDFSDLALFGLGNATAAPLETRVNISIESDEPASRIQEVIDRALETDPWYLALRDAQNVAAHLTVSRPDGVRLEQ